MGRRANAACGLRLLRMCHSCRDNRARKLAPDLLSVVTGGDGSGFGGGDARRSSRAVFNLRQSHPLQRHSAAQRPQNGEQNRILTGVRMSSQKLGKHDGRGCEGICILGIEVGAFVMKCHHDTALLSLRSTAAAPPHGMVVWREREAEKEAGGQNR